MFYETLFAALNKAGAKYMVAGGLAVNLHGVERSTLDIDIMIDLSTGNIKKAIRAFHSLGLLPKAPVKFEEFASSRLRKRWIAEKHMKVFTLWNPEIQWQLIDIFVRNPVNFLAAYKRRSIVQVGRMAVPVVSIRDLVKMKRLAGREKDLYDISRLQELSGYDEKKTKRK